MKICPKCHKNSIEIQVDLFLTIPGEMENLLSKKAIRDKRVIIQGANWPKANYLCTNQKCGWADLGRWKT